MRLLKWVFKMKDSRNSFYEHSIFLALIDENEVLLNNLLLKLIFCWTQENH